MHLAVKLAVLGFLKILEPNARLVFHIDLLIVPVALSDVNQGFDPVYLQLIFPLRAGDVVTCSLPRGSTPQLFDQGTVTPRHFVRNGTGNSLVNVLCRYGGYLSSHRP